MKRILHTIFLFIMTNNIFSQEKLFDIRDSISYETKLINELIWMKENLKYKSKNSFCTKKNEVCKLGNYYSNFDLESIVPENCRIPTINEWINLIKEGFLKSNIELTKMIIDTTENGSIRIRGINLFNVKDFIELKPTSWVEGGKINELYLKKKFSLATFWGIDEKNHNSLTHIHIKEKEIIIHSHDHNITDKEENVRMFSVRCVRK